MNLKSQERLFGSLWRPPYLMPSNVFECHLGKLFFSAFRDLPVRFGWNCWFGWNGWSGSNGLNGTVGLDGTVDPNETVGPNRSVDSNGSISVFSINCFGGGEPSIFAYEVVLAMSIGME